MRYRVVLVPFPFDDLSGTKIRPAVCLTEPIGTHRQVVLAFITSVVPTRLDPTDVLIESGTAEFARSGLKFRSALRLHRLVSVSTALIVRQVGMLSPKFQSEIQQRLRTLFGL